MVLALLDGGKLHVVAIASGENGVVCPGELNRNVLEGHVDGVLQLLPGDGPIKGAAIREVRDPGGLPALAGPCCRFPLALNPRRLGPKQLERTMGNAARGEHDGLLGAIKGQVGRRRSSQEHETAPNPGLASLTLVLARVIGGGIEREDIDADRLLVGACPVELGNHDGVLEGQIRVGAGKIIPRAGVDDFKLIPQLGRGLAQKALVLGALKAHIHVVVPGDEAPVPHRADGGSAVDRVVDAQLAADAVKLAQDARGELLHPDKLLGILVFLESHRLLQYLRVYAPRRAPVGPNWYSTPSIHSVPMTIAPSVPR